MTSVKRGLMRNLSIVMAFAMGITAAAAESATHAKISTSKGDIIVELYPGKAPKTVANFLQYASEGHYDRTLIHRVAPGALIQGGGYSRLFTERPVRAPIPYEGDNGLKNERGAIAMGAATIRRARRRNGSSISGTTRDWITPSTNSGRATAMRCSAR